MRRLLLTSLLLTAACDMASPTGPSPAEVSGFNAMDHWPEAKERLLNWLYTHPQCDSNYVTPSVTLREGNPNTCLYSESDVITYRPEMLEGCIAHELGHAALEQAGNDCWRPFEHDGIAPRRPE